MVGIVCRVQDAAVNEAEENPCLSAASTPEKNPKLELNL